MHQKQQKEPLLSSNLGWHHDHFSIHSLPLGVGSHCLPLPSCNIKQGRNIRQGLLLSPSHLCNFFLNNQCRQISILLNWHQKECLKVNKELCLQSVFLFLWNKCLFSLPFVPPGDKCHFGQRTQTEIYGMDSSVTWWANVSIPPPILFNNWTLTVQSLPEFGFLIKATLRRKGPNLHTGIFFLLGCTFGITDSLTLSEHAADIMSQRN